MSILTEAGLCLYNCGRAALAFAEQSMPSVACRTTSKIQKILFSVDLAAACYEGWNACNKLRNKFYSHHSTQTHDKDVEKYNKKFSILAALGTLSLLAASYFFVKNLNHFLAPKIDSKVVEEMKNMSATLTKPLVHELTQILFCTRIVFNLIQTCVSSEKCSTSADSDLSPSLGYLHFFNACLQALTLFKISKLQWTQVVRTFPDPFKTMRFNVQEGGTQTQFQDTVKELRVTFLIRTPLDKTFDFSSMMQTVHDYSSEMFQNSSWSRFWGNGYFKRAYERKNSLLPLSYNATLERSITPFSDRPVLFQYTTQLLHLDEVVAYHSREVWVNIKEKSNSIDKKNIVSRIVLFLKKGWNNVDSNKSNPLPL